MRLLYYFLYQISNIESYIYIYFLLSTKKINFVLHTVNKNRKCISKQLFLNTK